MMESWLAHVSCVGLVLGARQTGKTSLLLKLRHTLQNKYAFAFVNLQALAGADGNQCFRYIAEEVLEQLGEVAAGAQAVLPRGSQTFLPFLQRLSRESQAVRLVIMLDEIGALPQEVALKLASTIRAVFTDRFVKSEYSRYVFLLAGATDILGLATSKNSPLRNVSESIYLSDLLPAEIERLLFEVFGNRPARSVTEHICKWTGGHPYWTQLLAGSLRRFEQAHSADAVREIVEQLLQTEDKNLPHVFSLLESAEKPLRDLVASVLRGSTVSFSRSDRAIAELELIGLLKNVAGRCAIRNRIYQEAMYRYRSQPEQPPKAQRNREPWLDSVRDTARNTGFKSWAGAPKTTIAVVFTDIVGSTALGNEVGDEGMAAVREAHFRQGRGLIRKHRGYEIKTMGDAFMAAFHTAVEALDFALELSASTGHELVRIRAGIHVGPVRIEEEDAFGAVVKYAARVESWAKVPEIWVSARVKQDIDHEKARAHRSLRWMEHVDCELKGFPGKHSLWSTVASTG
jgi:class 3 adenylate cyclase